MILFDVYMDDFGDRQLYLEGTDQAIGAIIRGRDMVDLRGNTWIEWAFEPLDGSVPMGKTHKGISGAYEDARTYAETLT